MKCSICRIETGDRGCIILFGKEICKLCMKSIGSISVDNIFYDYYMDRIKDIEAAELKKYYSYK